MIEEKMKMASNIQLFKNQEFGSEVRIIQVEGKEWFVGKDVAECLGYSNPRRAIRNHCKNYINAEEFSTMGGTELVHLIDKQALLIPEGDIFRLIIKSKLPTAQKIESWIMDEVLPSIRKTGSYTHKKPQLTAPYKLYKELKNMSQTEFKMSKTSASIHANKLVKEKLGIDIFSEFNITEEQLRLDDLNNKSTVELFVDAECEITGNPKDFITRNNFRELYSNWCEKNGCHPLSAVQIGKELLKIGLDPNGSGHMKSYRENQERHRIRAYPGLKLK